MTQRLSDSQNGSGVSHGITPQPSPEGACRNTPQGNDGLAGAASTRTKERGWRVGMTLTDAHVAELSRVFAEWAEEEQDADYYYKLWNETWPKAEKAEQYRTYAGQLQAALQDCGKVAQVALEGGTESWCGEEVENIVNAALAENPNPSGRQTAEPSLDGTEGSGPVGLGPLWDRLFDSSADLARYLQREGKVTTREGVALDFMGAVIALDRATPPSYNSFDEWWEREGIPDIHRESFRHVWDAALASRPATGGSRD